MYVRKTRQWNSSLSRQIGSKYKNIQSKEIRKNNLNIYQIYQYYNKISTNKQQILKQQYSQRIVKYQINYLCTVPQRY